MEEEVFGGWTLISLILVPILANPHEAPRHTNEVIREVCEDDLTPFFQRKTTEVGHPISGRYNH